MPDTNLTGQVIRYALDLTGTSTDNYVEAEIIDLPSTAKRAVVLTGGPFYTESIVVYDNLTGQPLTKKTQYIAAQLIENATVRTGKEVCAVLIITDQSVSPQIRVNYQVVGGVYTLCVDALIAMVEAAAIDNRDITWGGIIGKPNLFPPGHHLHDLGDIYGFEYLVLALEEVRKAIIMGDTASHDEIYFKMGVLRQELIDLFNSRNDLLDNHLADFYNPHHTDKEDVGLSNVENYAVATIAEAQAGTSNDKYMTPMLTKKAVETYGANHTHDKLVNGAHNATLMANGTFISTGDSGAYSDERLKKDFKVIENPMEIINQLFGYYFTMIASGQESTGLSAQELLKAFPRIVGEDENGFLYVKYALLSGLFVEAFKEQDKRIISLEKENRNNSKVIHDLKKIIKNLSARLEFLESVIANK